MTYLHVLGACSLYFPPTYLSVCLSIYLISLMYVHTYIHTECPRRNVPDFGRVFLMLKYTDITQNTYIQSWMVTEIMAREKWGLLAVPNTATCTADTSRDNASVLESECSVHCACVTLAQSAMLRHRWAFSCIVLVTLRTTMTWVRVFL